MYNPLESRVVEIERRLNRLEEEAREVSALLRQVAQLQDDSPGPPDNITPPPPPPSGNFNCFGTLIVVDPTAVPMARCTYSNSSSGTTTTSYRPMHLTTIFVGDTDYDAWVTDAFTLSDFTGGARSCLLEMVCVSGRIGFVARATGITTAWAETYPTTWPAGPYDINFTHFTTPAQGFVSGEVALS